MPRKLNNRQMWKEASAVAGRVGLNADKMTAAFFPRLLRSEIDRRAATQLRGAMRRWLHKHGGPDVLGLVRRGQCIDPNQLLLFPDEPVGDYALLSQIPTAVLRAYVNKIEAWIDGMSKIVRLVREHLARRESGVGAEIQPLREDAD